MVVVFILGPKTAFSFSVRQNKSKGFNFIFYFAIGREIVPEKSQIAPDPLQGFLRHAVATVELHVS